MTRLMKLPRQFKSCIQGAMSPFVGDPNDELGEVEVG